MATGTSSSSSSTGRIRQFRSGEPMDDKEAQRTWNSLKDAIKEIHAHNASTLSFEELYRNAYNLVLHKKGEMLYEGVTNVVRDHLREVAQKAVVEATDEKLLEELKAQWDDHKTTMAMIRDILMYMDRNYGPPNKKLPVYDMGLLEFKNEVCQKIKPKLLKTLLQYVSEDRKGAQIDKILLSHTVNMLVELTVPHHEDVYHTYFESWYLEDASKFYHAESNRYISENTCADYLRKAESRIHEEKMRVQSYLSDRTSEKIQTLMDKEWVKAHYMTLIEMPRSGCAVMFEEGKKEDMARLYALFSRIPEAIKSVQDCMASQIQERGKEIVRDDTKSPVDFTLQLLDLREKYADFVRVSFLDSKEFQISLKHAFEGFLNESPKAAQHLSLYVDDLFRKGLKRGDEREIEKNLQSAVTLFRFLQDKDVFESYYKGSLAKRLLSTTKHDYDQERMMISKLKQECGQAYTQKLEGMLQDMRQSEDLMKQFNDSSKKQDHAAVNVVEISVTVLAQNYWGGSPGVDMPPARCNLQAELALLSKTFETFYIQKHNGRRLQWNEAQGSCEVKAFMPKKTHEFTCSLYQYLILNQFNDLPAGTTSVSYTDLLEQTKIPEDEFKRHLHSMYTHPKYRIMAKNSVSNPNESASTETKKGKEPIVGDLFSINAAFTHQLYKMKVPLIASKSPEETSKQRDSNSGDMPSNVEEDRKQAVEAVIVRVMKSRKSLEHNKLVIEVTKHLQTRFQPTPHLIKQRIEKLIEREYLERSESDRKVYNYLA